MTIKTHENADHAQADDDHPTDRDIRREIYRQLRRADGRYRENLTDDVALSLDCDEGRVIEQLDALADARFVYVDDEEVVLA